MLYITVDSGLWRSLAALPDGARQRMQNWRGKESVHPNSRTKHSNIASSSIPDQPFLFKISRTASSFVKYAIAWAAAVGAPAVEPSSASHNFVQEVLNIDSINCIQASDCALRVTSSTHFARRWACVSESFRIVFWTYMLNTERIKMSDSGCFLRCGLPRTDLTRSNRAENRPYTDANTCAEKHQKRLLSVNGVGMNLNMKEKNVDLLCRSSSKSRPGMNLLTIPAICSFFTCFTPYLIQILSMFRRYQSMWCINGAQKWPAQ